MSKPSHEHGIENEPHLQAGGHHRDPSEAKADRLLQREGAQETDADRVEHNVWEEPALARELIGPPDESQLTYERWLDEGIKRTTFFDSLEVTVLVLLAAGPWGVIGAFASAGVAGWQGIGLWAVVIFGPVAEEVTKISAAWWVVEKRPYLFQSTAQILFCAGCSGAAFAAIENLIYLYVYIPNHSVNLMLFRWSVCVGLHVCCSMVAGVGLARIWDNCLRNRHRPRVALGIPWLVIAMAGHGLYNFTVIIATYTGWLNLQ